MKTENVSMKKWLTVLCMLTLCIIGAAGGMQVKADEIGSVRDLQDTQDYCVFASEPMGFSFLYDPAHTAYMTSAGAAMLAINGDEARTGLFVSVVDAENFTSPEEYFEEEIFNLQQRYQNAMAVQPEMDTLEIEGHMLTGIAYSYSMPTGGTVDCTEFVEVRDGKYIFYDTRDPRGEESPALQAMGAAMMTLEMDAGFYGTSDAGEGGLPVDDFEPAADHTIDEDWGRADAAPVNLGAGEEAEFQSGFSFDMEDTWLVLSDETTTQVYTGGAMDGAYFCVERVTLEENIGDTVVHRKNEVTEALAERKTAEPDIQMLEIGDRRLAGFVCSYSAVDGSKTIIAEEFYEELDGDTYCWYAIYDKGDEITPVAFEHAMETFTLDS